MILELVCWKTVLMFFKERKTNKRGWAEGVETVWHTVTCDTSRSSTLILGYAHSSLFREYWLLSFMIIRRSIPKLARQFSSTALLSKNVSIIGREPIKFPPSVTITPSPTQVTITGPLGTTSVPLESYMTLAFPLQDTMKLTVEKSEKKLQRQMWGTTRTLISNAIIGMTEGFSVPLYLVGVGYRVALEEDPRGSLDGGNGKRLNLRPGYSHSVFVPIPSHIKAEVPSPTKIILSCTDKHLLGLFAAKIRAYRKPEPYKGKVSSVTFVYIHLPMTVVQGIFIGSEVIRIKSVKKK